VVQNKTKTELFGLNEESGETWWWWCHALGLFAASEARCHAAVELRWRGGRAWFTDVLWLHVRR